MYSLRGEMEEPHPQHPVGYRQSIRIGGDAPNNNIHGDKGGDPGINTTQVYRSMNMELSPPLDIKSMPALANQKHYTAGGSARKPALSCGGVVGEISPSYVARFVGYASSASSLRCSSRVT